MIEFRTFGIWREFGFLNFGISGVDPILVVTTYLTNAKTTKIDVNPEERLY